MKKHFESRFMPNVKFRITPENSAELIEIYNYDELYKYYGGCTNSDGFLISLLCSNKEIQLYELQTLNEVSIYEAIPELIPDGMKYNKELDKLVPDVVSTSDEYCSGIKVEFEKVVDYTKNINIKELDKQILDELKKSGKSYLEVINIIKNTDTFTPSYYGAKCKCGEKLDAYAICDKYSNKHKTSAWHHAVKKLLRAGDGHKPLLKDIDEVIDSLKRWKEQLNAK